MYTSILVFALTGSVAADAASLTWQNDYVMARSQVQREGKPLAVFIGLGESGWEKVGKDNALSNEVKRVLANKYTCVYVDSKTDEGKRLAKDFEMPGGLGLVISDKTGDLQVFHHQGTLSNEALATYLVRYADPNRVVQTTDSHSSSRTSYYSGPNGSAPETGALAQVNALRAARGLPPYQHDPQLHEAAKACAAHRATYRIAGHTANDFVFVPAGASATSAGCAAWPRGSGFGSCCIYDGYRYAGAATVLGADGVEYHQIFVR
jgi:hypothetical protein